MDKEEHNKKFESNIEYIRKNIPPDDIYLFAELCLMSACFFLGKWNEFEDLQKVIDQDRLASKYIKNITSFRMMQDAGIGIDIDFGLDK